MVVAKTKRCEMFKGVYGHVLPLGVDFTSRYVLFGNSVFIEFKWVCEGPVISS